MIIRINSAGETPVYAQIVQQVKFAIASGTLRSGERLPSVRELATQLRINPNTVARAYRDLEYEDLVQTEKGRGVFVSQEAGRLTKTERLGLITESLDQLIHDAERLALSDDDLIALLARRLKRRAKGGSSTTSKEDEQVWTKSS